jgi:hypothetical protein
MRRTLRGHPHLRASSRVGSRYAESTTVGIEHVDSSGSARTTYLDLAVMTAPRL